MIARIYLKEIKPENLLAEVLLEVVPRGIYEIDGVAYQYTGQPKFIITSHPETDFYRARKYLETVEFTVEKL